MSPPIKDSGIPGVVSLVIGTVVTASDAQVFDIVSSVH